MITNLHMSDSSNGHGPSQNSPQPSNELIGTLDLLERFKLGDEQAVAVLVERAIPPLRRWARGRLPAWARGLAETQI